MAADSLPPQQVEINVLIVHAADVSMANAIARLHGYVKAGALDPFLSVTIADPARIAPVHVHNGALAQPTDLLDALSAVRVLERVRLVTVSSDPREEEWAAALCEGYERVRPMIDQVKGRHTNVSDVRVQAVAVEENLQGEGVFSRTSTANIILIPHDRSSDHAAARLVRRDDEARFGSHLAVELATLTGGWTTMAEAPCDRITYGPAASDDITVRFSRSLVRALFCPPLPVDRVVPTEGALPTPPGFFPSPDPAATAHAVAAETFPAGLRFHASQRPVQRTEIPLAQALRAVPRRLWAVLRSLPHVLRDGLTRDLESLAGDGLQEVIGRDAWLSVAFRDRQDHTDVRPWSQRADESIAALEMRDEMPIMSDVSSTLWIDMIQRVLGVADGSRASSEAREGTGEGRFLLVEPRALSAPPAGSPSATIESHLELLDPLDAPPTEPEPLPPPPLGAVEGELAIEVPGDAVTESPEGSPVAPRLSIRDALTHRSSFSLPPAGLLGAITEQFIDEKQRADDHLKAMVDEMRSLVEESDRDSNGTRVPLVIRLLLAGAAMVFVFAVTVFTGAHRFFDLHWMSLGWRQAIWLTLTALVLIPCWFILAFSGTKSRIGLGATLGLLALSIYLALNPAIRESEVIVRNIGRSYWPMWPVTVATVATAVTTRLLTPFTPGNWRSSLARFMTWWTSFYAMAVVIVSASSARSIFQSVEPNAPGTPGSGLGHLDSAMRQKLLVLFVSLSVLGFLVGLLAIGIMWVRIEYRNRNRGQRFMFAEGEAIRSSRARRRLQLLTTQWLGSSVALTRMIWRPLGELGRMGNSERDSLVDDNDLLKFDAAGLRLTERGDAMMLARLRSLLVHPGWLMDQYRRAAELFIARDPEVLDRGSRPEERPSPESDPSIVPLNEVLAGRTSGRRWGFASALFDGTLDDALSAVITDNEPEKIFDVILRDPSAHQTVGAIDAEADIASYFESLLPAGPQELPVGLSKAVFTASDPRRSMNTYVSWPDDFMPRPTEVGESIETAASGLMSGTVIMATRIDVSQPFRLGEIADLAVLGTDDTVAEPGTLL